MYSDKERTFILEMIESGKITSDEGLNLLKAEKTLRVGIKSKRLNCGWNHNYLLKVLTGPPKKI